ncbi:MAG: winged helix-turn-helix domain-containing protein [Acidobacteria bacterium]|nr:winged helix-turn-helix domain-containing protein [Acidobacteriota bacterium]
MKDLDEIINQSKDVREVKRALGVKMALSEMPTSHICARWNVSQPFVSKWRTKYEIQGAEVLLLGYQGSRGRLSAAQRQEVLGWLGSQETIRIAELRDYLEDHYQVVYQSKQSYYELLQAAGLSYHKSEKKNPKRDEAQVVEQQEVIKKSGAAL